MNRRIAYTILLAAATLPLHAGTFSFAGTLGSRDDIALFALTLNSDSLVTFRTFSYAGGQDAAGNLIPDGGFDTAVAIFQAGAPQFLLTLDDAEHCGSLFVGADPTTGLCLDSEMVDVPLPAGSYLVSLTQSDHLPAGPTLSDGFTPGTAFGDSDFVDFTGAARTGSWELDILGASSAAQVPEPGSMGLLLVGPTIVFCRLSRRRSKPGTTSSRHESAAPQAGTNGRWRMPS
jgi:hypothetical protein